MHVYDKHETPNIDVIDNYLRIRHNYLDEGYLLHGIVYLKQEYHRIYLYE